MTREAVAGTMARAFRWSKTMLFLAGLMGMALVGASVFVGMDAGVDGAQEDESQDDLTAEEAQEAEIISLGELIAGGADGEELSGGDGDDSITAGAGDDTVEGGAGDDHLRGALGDDVLRGEDGDDTLHGELGDDTLTGGAGDDQMFGHVGDDLMRGGAGNDTLEAGDGDDVLIGGGGDDALHGYLGDDKLEGGAGQDTLFGGWGNDVLIGTGDGSGAEAQDFLNGGGGDDAIFAGAGDIVHGGDGADTIVVSEWTLDESAQMTDFDISEDTLVVLYDDAVPDTEYELSLATDALDDELTHVLLNGEIVLSVMDGGTLTLGDVQLVPQSAADTLLSGAVMSSAA